MFKIDEILDNLTLEDLYGQVLCIEISDKDDPKEVEETVKKIKPGGIYVSGMLPDKIKSYTEMINRYVKIPIIVAADIEFGPGSAIKGETLLPHPMAWGACDDSDLIERAGYLTGKIARASGISWTFSPVMDINYNFNNPITNIRAVSDSPKQVVKIAGAYAKGLQKANVVACCKHFPGDGVDDRNQHFCTTVNSLSKTEWDKTYGYVYKEISKMGIGSVMAAHIALPCYEKQKPDMFGYLPSVLSKSLLTELLRNQLGYNGCIVSDAMSMIGACSRVDLDQLAVSFLNAGGDMVLFPEKNDFDNIKHAVERGVLKKDVLLRAVKNIISMKSKAKLFESEQENVTLNKDRAELKKIAQLIADKSIKTERDVNHLLPQKIKKGGKVLLINLYAMSANKNNKKEKNVLSGIRKDLNKRGYETTVLNNPGHYYINSIMNEYDLVLVNARFLPAEFTSGSSLRINWDSIMTFWRGYLLKHKNVIFCSFGDPYKLYEFPYLKTYVNAFSDSEFSQKAFLKAVLGEIELTAKNPVGLKGFFEREVE